MNPFSALGLPADPHLTDEQVRAAWRSIAAATHPDRPYGGDPARYAAASAAYDRPDHVVCADRTR
jgi:curved DNA-binding protein CbpA